MIYRYIKPVIFTFLTGVFFLYSTAQKQSYNWYFGNKAGISFANGVPTALTDGAIITPEGVATISDKQGNLLFYTDGRYIWNRQHTSMPSASMLLGHPSSTQSAIIIPQPGNDSIYYVFTVDAFGGFNGLSYVTVNMKRDNGLGDVIHLPIQLLTPTCEKITAVKHCNNKDIWLITRDRMQMSYYAWLITTSGISAIPVISLTNNLVSSEIGYLKGSPDGKKLAAVHFNNYTELSDFNNTTGSVSNTIKIAKPQPVPGTNYSNCYGIEFSPNNHLVYISTFYSFGSTTKFASIDQYNITNHDSVSIAQSHFTVTTDADIHSAMQLAYDNKIYIVDNGKRKLNTIYDPNKEGVACNYQAYTVDLGTGLGYSGLPTFIQSLFNPAYDGYQFSVNNDCNALQKKFTINDLSYIDSVKWNFGDPLSGANDSSVNFTPTHVFSGNGPFLVKLRIFKSSPCFTGIDTIEKTINIDQIIFSLGSDTVFCDNNQLSIDAFTPGAVGYTWNTGAITPAITINETGNYWCKISLNGCYYTDTINITKKYAPDFSLGRDTNVCLNRPLVLKPVIDPSWQLLWQDGSSQNFYTVTTAGQYRLTATNSCGFTIKQINIAADACDIYIPGAFTPDGNANNDKFTILGTASVTELDFEIYNRYGLLIFKTKDKNTGWDGNIAGKPALSGVYIYKLKYRTIGMKKTEQLNGSFILIR
jgi:gliding motility-associated-like protein